MVRVGLSFPPFPSSGGDTSIQKALRSVMFSVLVMSAKWLRPPASRGRSISSAGGAEKGRVACS